MIDKSIRKLVCYGLETNLVNKRDVCFVTNRILEILNLESFDCEENFENVNLKKLENPVWFKITFNNCKNVNIKKINQNISNLEKWFFENDYTRVLENSIAIGTLGKPPPQPISKISAF